MKIRNIKTYYLNSSKPQYAHRHEYMEKVLSDLKFTNYERHIFDFNGNKYLGTTLGHMSMVEQAMKNDEYPFMILEDDATPIYDFDIDIEEEILESSDMIYLGGSLWIGPYNDNTFAIKSFNEKYYRVTGLLTLHSVVLTKRRSAEIFLELGTKSRTHGFPLDAYIAKTSNNYELLSPKDGPYFFQPDYEKFTKFLWSTTNLGTRNLDQ